jgi:hypothetical protein
MTQKNVEVGSPWNEANTHSNFGELYASLALAGLMAPAAGFLGTGTVYKSSVKKEGDFIKTEIYIDLTGAKSSTTDLDIIGNTGVAYIGQITDAINGDIVGGKVTCLEAPVGGVTDIDLYSAVEATGAYDAGVGPLDETAIVTSGSAWALGTIKALSALPAENDYLYLTCGAADSPGTYTAGKFMIELFGI